MLYANNQILIHVYYNLRLRFLPLFRLHEKHITLYYDYVLIPLVRDLLKSAKISIPCKKKKISLFQSQKADHAKHTKNAQSAKIKRCHLLV